MPRRWTRSTPRSHECATRCRTSRHNQLNPQTAVISRAAVADLDVLAPLFDAYRTFYRRPLESEAARAFLSDRLERDESIVFIARDGEAALGFAQLYPQFSSLELKRNWLLGDLFVAIGARRQGVGAALLQACEDYARGEGASAITLETAIGNRVAQRVYESAGWLRESAWYQYARILR
jgi:GNAT superfamily N-acetyltransferase